MMKRWLSLLLALILSGVMLLSGCSELGIDANDLIAIGGALLSDYAFEQEIIPADDGTTLREDGHYSSKAEVGLYLYLYGKLPSNFITKKEAQNLGWVSKEGNLWEVAPGMSIGGDKFGNYEGLLPEAKGRQYYECDIDTVGRDSRGAKRLVYSNDGLIYYTEDHYETFELLYGEE